MKKATPEPEEVKINVGVSSETDQIQDGDFVWAKVKGHNWWPAEVGL